jgi:hypothetical protein
MDCQIVNRQRVIDLPNDVKILIHSFIDKRVIVHRQFRWRYCGHTFWSSDYELVCTGCCGLEHELELTWFVEEALCCSDECSCAFPYVITSLRQIEPGFIISHNLYNRRLDWISH